MFSFNNPFGACPTCTGLGTLMKVDKSSILDENLSFNQGALRASGWRTVDEGGSMARAYLQALAKHFGFSLDTPVKDLDAQAVDSVLYGTKGLKLKIEYRSDRGVSSFTSQFEGVIPNLERRFRETNSPLMKEELGGYMIETVCPDSGGRRLNRHTRAYPLAHNPTNRTTAGIR